MAEMSGRVAHVLRCGRSAIFPLAAALAVAGVAGGRWGGERTARAAGSSGPIPESRPLRYHPDGADFVIENGENWFNRPLYGPHVAFRTDGGDKPEFALLNTTMKDGVLRLGIVHGAEAKWLTDAANVTTRYRPGSLIYEVRDPLLGNATLRVTVLSLTDGQGIVLRSEYTQGKSDAQLVFAFGGVIDLKGKRPSGRTVSAVRAIDENNGDDLRPDLQLMPAQCKGNVVSAEGSHFSIDSGKETVEGRSSAASPWRTVDAGKGDSLHDMLQSQKSDTPIVLQQATLDQPVYLAIERKGGEATTGDQREESIEKRFAASAAHREEVAGTLSIDTPDPFINAVPAALCVAADGCWQPPVWVHGAVSWRTGLLGWRGAYIGDALGWHDRASAYFTHWAAKQNTSDDFPTVAIPNPKRNLAENDGGMLHSNGSIPASHYDMNLVYIDALFRHLLWTGDKEMARTLWPVIQRHLAWEKRCFDRDGLYEGYACIWASDALQYNGGGAAHSTAYNEFHHRMAARVAQWIGEDPHPYEAEANRIHAAMQKRLWLPEGGWYAEYQDSMGEQQVHPSAALWSIYHTIDSQVPDSLQAWQCLRYVDTHIAHIPVQGPGVPANDFHVLPTSDWAPYEWSLNNVVTAETQHTALAYWQGGRPDEAFNLFKGTILDTMFLGMEPGNIPNLSAYDPYRGESYTDFADPIGMTSRSLVEGLFGIRPDALRGELLIHPGFPADWDHAEIRLKDLSSRYRREGLKDSWNVSLHFPVPMRLRLQLPARGDRVSAVTVNGQPAEWSNVEGAVGTPCIEVNAKEPGAEFAVDVTWAGSAPAVAAMPPVVAEGSPIKVSLAPAKATQLADPQHAFEDAHLQPDELTATASSNLGGRTAFAKVTQGDLTWWMPLAFELRPSVKIEQPVIEPATAPAFTLQNNTAAAIEGTAHVHVGAQTLQLPLRIPSGGISDELRIPAGTLLPGTNPIRIDLPDGSSVTGTLTDWSTRKSDLHYEPIDLSAAFNDSVTHIFTNDYLTPRPTTCSLQMPLHGIGDWTGPTRTYAVDDSGLRRAAVQGIYTLPNGVPFKTPAADGAKNILFTSQWDNYPRQASVPLEGRASHAYFLVAGSTTAMEAQLENGELVVQYQDGSTEVLPLRNPSNWWPIDQNYRMDKYAFRRRDPIPLRVELGTGKAYCPESDNMSRGGAATVVDMVLDPQKPLKSVTLHTKSYEIVMGMMAVTLVRPESH